MLSELESFKAGFLTRCVEDGLSTEEALSRVKSASDSLDAVEKQGALGLESGVEAIAKTLRQLGGLGLATAVAAPPVLGGIAGYAHSKLSDVDEEDVDHIKKQELIDEYKRQADKLRQSQSLRAYRDRRKASGGVYL